jgi:uncharacterized membrane protein YkoI
MKRRYLVAVAAGLVVAAGGVGIAQAVRGEDDASEQASGPAAHRARAAALRLVPGSANSIERDSENGATWEVEVERDSDGKQVDVRLDENHRLVVVEGDSEDADAK